MIAFVSGEISVVNEDNLIIDLGGVGLQVLAPLKAMNPRPYKGQKIMLYTHLQVREDAWQLYGFMEEQQLSLFRHLLAVSGIGAKTALAIVDNISAEGIIRALAEGNFDLFCKVPGVGKKTAQRLVVDLKDKFSLPFGRLGAGESDASFNTDLPTAYSDLLAALEQLGYRGAESRALAMQAHHNLGETAQTAQLLQEALKIAAQD